MTKPEPPAFVPGRFLSAALIACCVWMLLQMVAPYALVAFQTQRRAPYVAVMASGDTAKERALFDRDIRSHPTDQTLYETIAAVCEQAGRYDLATEYLERGVEACKTAPAAERAELYVLLSGAYHYSEKSKPQSLAIAAAKNALDLEPDSPDYLNAYGYLLADNDQNLDVALAKTGRALELLRKLPDDPASKLQAALVEDSYGWALFKQHRYDAAESALSVAVSDIPQEAVENKSTRQNLAELYYHLGACYRARKNAQLALQNLRTAVAFDPGHTAAKAELTALEKEAAAQPTPAAGSGPAPPVGTSVASSARPSPTANAAPAVSATGTRMSPAAGGVRATPLTATVHNSPGASGSAAPAGHSQAPSARPTSGSAP